MDKDKLLERLNEIKIYGLNIATQIDDDLNNGLIIRLENSYGVALPYDSNTPIYYEFVGVKVETQLINYKDLSINALFLSADNSIRIEQFVYIAQSFLDKDNRDKVLSKTFEWIEEWKNIFGNSIKNYMVYDVLGELESLLVLYKIDKSLKWMGPVHGSYDISGKTVSYEVKSSISKGPRIIKTSSSRQLSDKIDERLLFVSLESDYNGDTINKLVKKLVENGYDYEELERKLECIGYKKGSQQRDIGYRLIGIYLYKVDKNTFPIISLEEINKYSNYKSIINYSLTLDLTGIPFETIF